MAEPKILLSTQALSKRYGPRPLFQSLTFGLFEGERTGLIGPNGSGKSTLLKILAGLETPDEGTLAARRGLKVRYVAQQDALETVGGTVGDVLHHAVAVLGIDAYEVEQRIAPAAAAWDLDLSRPIETLSGGWRKRLAILAQTLAEPDLLLLDEPTNHLDLEGVLWLERLLQSVRFSFVVVTHDRRFLEAVCNRIIETNKRYPEGFFSSAGDYARFLEAREALFESEAAREAATRNRVRQEIEWLKRGPKARTTKQKARIDRAHAMMDDLKDLTYRNAQDRTAAIHFTGSERRTKRLIETQGLEKRMGGRKLFGPLDMALGPGDKLGLLGSNGSGKSTLLKILTGALEPDAGHVKRADGLRIVTFDQHREQLDLSLPLRKALCENGEHVHYNGRPIHVAGWAERFLFNKNQLDLSLSRLSGGEQSRVLIARLMLRPADLLLLDEPTNDLDIGSLEVLEASLMEFPGAVVLVTHDRFLLDRVSDEILALDGRGHASFYADLNQWEESQGGAAPMRMETLEASLSVAPPAPPAIKRGLNAKEAKELRQIEAEIRALETETAKAKAALHDRDIATNAEELLKRQSAVETLDARMLALMERWEILEARR